MQFRKKPVVIEAKEYDLQNCHQIAEWISANGGSCEAYSDGSGLEIRTLEGDMMAYPGDWIIKGIKGEFYACKPDIFAMTYEPVEA